MAEEYLETPEVQSVGRLRYRKLRKLKDSQVHLTFVAITLLEAGGRITGQLGLPDQDTRHATTA